MLAQINSKQKSIFFNIKPTVIDKLISKNKSSIQNSSYANEDSEESQSEDSDKSSTTSRESGLTTECSLDMAPLRRKEHINVLGSKLASRSQFQTKRGVGRKPRGGRGGSNLRIMAVKKALESSKRSPSNKTVQSSLPTVKRKMNSGDPPSKVTVKRPKVSVKKESILSISERVTEDTYEPVKPKRGRPRLLKNVETSKKKILNKDSPSADGDTPNLLKNKGSPRKFPSNVMDRWKSTSMAIRGRGRGRGSYVRGGIKRGTLRSERVTRNNATGIMRSGKLRKYSDNLEEGLDPKVRRKRVIDRIKIEKDCPSDEQSSFVTTSELSFCDNDVSMKQSDDELINPESVKIKLESENTEDEAVRSRDSNSNVFVGKLAENDDQTKLSCRSSDTNDQTVTKRTIIGPRKFGRGRKRLSLISRKKITQCELNLNVRDSDCSLDSDLTDVLRNSPKSEAKRYRRKCVDGTWVRRSTRSVGKTSEAESSNLVIDDLLKDDTTGDSTSYSKSSLNFDQTISDSSNFIDEAVLIKIESNHKDASEDISEKSKSVHSDSLEVDFCFESENTNSNNNIDTNNDSINKMNDTDSFTDFSLFLEETPVKNCVKSPELNKVRVKSPELKSCLPSKLHFDSPTKESNINKSHSQSAGFTEKQETNVDVIKSVIEIEQLNNYKDVRQQSSEPVGDKIEQLGSDEHMDNLFSNNIDKSAKPKISDSDLISDEIVSLIDSFCQSESAEEGTQNLIVNDVKDLVESVSNFIAEDNNKYLEEPIKESFDSINKQDIEIQTPCLLNCQTSEETLKLKSDLICEKTNSNAINSKIFMDTKKNEDDNLESNSSILQNDNESIPHIHNENTETNMFENDSNMKMDIDHPDKAVESTEESSSSDSNSNLSEVISLSVESNSEVLVNKCDSLNTGLFEGTQRNEKVDGKSFLEDSERSAKSQDSNYFSSVNSYEVNKSEEVISQNKLSTKPSVDDGSVERPSKELLSALGLKSLHCAAEEKPKRPTDSYTGTLKAVIKLNRSSDKKGRKIFFKQVDKLTEDCGGGGDRLEYRIRSAEELATDSVPLTHLADIPANRKTHMKVKSQFDLSNSPNIVGASGSMDTPTSTDANKETGGKQNLIIPEKSSSFSIHPERLCTDFCSYCFGKFGSLDTPCHLAQLKNSERQAKILAIEVHLSVDSCLCDGCFRYVDRKANCPTSQRSRKPAQRRGPLAGTECAVQDCSQPARHSVRRKWLIKLKKSIGKKLLIDMDKNPTLPFPLCSQHYYWVDYFTVCGICKKRLTRNHMYALGAEADELNQALSDDGIPVRLSDKLFLCKLCRYYSSLRLRYRDPTTISNTHRLFLNSYRKKILHYHDIPVSDSEEEGKSLEEESTSSEAPKAKRKKSKSKSVDENEHKKRNIEKGDKSDNGNEERSNDSQMVDYTFLDKLNVHREDPTPSPSVEYNSLRDFEGQVGFSNIASLLNPLDTAQGTIYPADSQNRTRVDQPARIQVKFGNLNIGKLSNLNIGQDSRPSTTSTPVLERPPYLPGEKDLKMSGEFQFHGALNSNSSWERLTSTIQFDHDTKKLWQELQRPYGSQSSFLRHLVILEKHWRSGTLVFSENPNQKAVKYLNSVKNRVQAYDGAKSVNASVTKPNQNEVSLPPRPVSTPVRVPSAPPPLMKIAPGNTPWLTEQLRKPPPYPPVTSTQTSRAVPVTAPPPYRLPTPRPNVRLIRTSAPSNIRPSMSYQQFKRIRLESPVPSTSMVAIIPKLEPAIDNQSTATSNTVTTDFVPMICDVRSLATSNSPTALDWNESFRKQQQKLLQQKYFTPILPKMPNSLTVMTIPQSSSVVMKTSSLTIEKATNANTKSSIAPPEKPSISVFRETTPSENG